MKRNTNIYRSLQLGLGLIMLSSLLWTCSTTYQKGGTASSDKVNNGYTYQNRKDATGAASSVDNPERTLDLTAHLQKLPGVNVRGQGENAKVSIRGSEASSFSLPTDPLFVVNGNAIGTDFATIYHLVNMNEIKNITVLKDGSTTSIYGSRGANGVIVIDLK